MLLSLKIDDDDSTGSALCSWLCFSEHPVCDDTVCPVLCFFDNEHSEFFKIFLAPQPQQKIRSFRDNLGGDDPAS